ncbi:2Fe-2S iron-sulfur cluster-binding protein [Microbacterium sp. NPDC055910]|uniref:2Fe-2S iron-sulfur cluster-binding protein n=1 Tax=Microbacterium sp. NPDC055910 TaxID=3345659 RepID=UPI0035D9D466
MSAQVTYVSASGEEVTFEGDAGDSVMEVATRNGLSTIVAECGGSMSCSTCHVFVDEASSGLFEPLTELEDEMLDTTAVDREECSRLSCQLVLPDGAVVRVTTPETQM